MLHFQYQCKPIARIAVVSLMLIGLLLSAVPLPIGVVFITGGKFPCMAGSCGCTSAEKCWTSCCCHTPAQRVAWAKANNVEIPAYAKEQVLALAKQETCSQPKAAAGSCCSKADAAGDTPTVKVAAKTVKSGCCSSKSRKSDVACDSCESEEKAEGTQAPQIVLSLMAVRCRGAAGEFTSLPWCINKLIFPVLEGPIDRPSTVTVFSECGEPSPWPPIVPPPKPA